MTKQQKENVKTWIKALRSGKYRQGKNRLKMRDGSHTKYCCLGVACNVLNLLGYEGDTELDAIDFEQYFGIDYDFQDVLIKYNDKDNLTFKAIADKIEKKIK